MAVRPIWRGHLRLALVSCPVALFNARHDRTSIRFSLINFAASELLLERYGFAFRAVGRCWRWPFCPAQPRLRDRALRALAAMVQEFGYDIQSTFPISDNLRLHAISYSADEEELSVLLEILEGDGLIKTASLIPTKVHLTTAGLIQAEELSQPGAAYLQGFVAMSFDPSMNEAYTSGFDPGIRAAGYRPFRIDGKDHINGISDEILAEVRRSRFLVADYTLMNNGVYFEAGVAVGLGIPVIPTCRADHLDKLHFDIKHINTLKWETPEQLARDLAKRISGVIGDGPAMLSDNSTKGTA